MGIDEQIDDLERKIRIKELQLAYLRGDITLAEHDRRRARYDPRGATEDTAAAILARHAVPERRKVSKFGQWIARWMKH